jgi:gliding motility-associated-like protein
MITVYAYPEVDLGPDTLLPYSGSIILDAGNPGAGYEWSTGATSQNILMENLKKDTLVSVVVSNNGCISEDERMIRVEPAPISRAFVPNAFTPDGDGYNDTFYPVLANVEEAEFMVFDRWGRMMFRSRDQDLRWDGRCGTAVCPDGVYVWKLIYDARLEDERMERKVETGTVALIR